MKNSTTEMEEVKVIVICLQVSPRKHLLIYFFLVVTIAVLLLMDRLKSI